MGASTLFRIQAFPDYGEHQQQHQPLSVHESSYAALPLALLVYSAASLHTTIITHHLHQLLVSFPYLLLLFCRAIACLLPPSPAPNIS